MAGKNSKPAKSRPDYRWEYILEAAAKPASRWLRGLKVPTWRPVAALMRHVGRRAVRRMCREFGERRPGRGEPKERAVKRLLEYLVAHLEERGACMSRPGDAGPEFCPVVGAEARRPKPEGGVTRPQAPAVAAHAAPPPKYEWGMGVRPGDAALLASFTAGRAPAWAAGDIASRAGGAGPAVLVAQAGGRPAGFLACDIATRIAGPRRALHVTMTILHMAVDPRRRLEGVGRFLIDAVAGSLASNEGRPTHPAGRVRVRAVVPEGWLDAQLFLRAIGFRAPVENAVRRAPFDAHDGDGYVMVRDRHWGRADPASDGVPDSGVVAA